MNTSGRYRWSGRRIGRPRLQKPCLPARTFSSYTHIWTSSSKSSGYLDTFLPEETDTNEAVQREAGWCCCIRAAFARHDSPGEPHVISAVGRASHRKSWQWYCPSCCEQRCRAVCVRYAMCGTSCRCPTVVAHPEPAMYHEEVHRAVRQQTGRPQMATGWAHTDNCNFCLWHSASSWCAGCLLERACNAGQTAGSCSKGRALHVSRRATRHGTRTKTSSHNGACEPNKGTIYSNVQSCTCYPAIFSATRLPSRPTLPCSRDVVVAPAASRGLFSASPLNMPAMASIVVFPPVSTTPTSQTCCCPS